jgi:hypothetical protein
MKIVETLRFILFVGGISFGREAVVWSPFTGPLNERKLHQIKDSPDETILQYCNEYLF